MLWGDMVRRACVAITMLGLLAWASPARAQRIAVLDLEAPGDLRAEAGAITMLLRTHLPTDSRPSVPLAELVEQFGGRRGPLMPGSDPGAAMAALNADRLVSGTLIRSGTKVKITLEVLGPDGKKLDTLTASGPRGSLNGLVTTLLREAADTIGDNFAERPRGALGKLRPFVTAAEALAGKDPNRAARALLASEANVVYDVPATREIAETVWKDPSVSFDLRAAVAMVSGDADELRKMAENRLRDDGNDELGHAALAAALMARGDLRGARKSLEKIEKSNEPLAILVRAQYADRKNDPRTRDQLVNQLLELKPPFTPALGWIARLPPGRLGDVVERRAVAIMEDLQDTYPGLAASVGLRAARSRSTDKGKALGLVEVIELGDQDLPFLAAPVSEMTDAETAVGFRLRAEMTLRSGENEASAMEDISRAIAASKAEGGEGGEGGDDGGDEQARLMELQAAVESELGPPDAPPGAGGPGGPGGPTAVALGQGGGTSGQGAGGTQAKDKPSADMLSLAGKLSRFIQSFPPLVKNRPARVVVAALDGSGAPFYSPYKVNVDRLRSGLTLVLLQPPYSIDVAPGGGISFADPPSKNALMSLAQSANAGGVLLYQLTNDGADAAIRLVYFDVASESASEFKDTLPGRENGLVGWNFLFVMPVALLVLGLLGFVASRIFRGKGTITIKVELDNAIQRDVVCVRLTRKEEAPDMSHPMSFSDRMRKQGVKKRRYSSDMFGRKETFERIPIGTWYVTLYGTYEKGNELRVIEGDVVREVVVERGKTQHVVFDLRSSAAEYRLTVFDGDKPADAEVWLDDDRDSRQKVGRDGHLEIKVPKGKHVLHVMTDDTHIRRELHVTDVNVHNVTINLVRERRMQEISKGIELEEEDDPAARFAAEAAAIAARPPDTSGEAQPALTVEAPDAESLIAAAASQGDLGLGLTFGLPESSTAGGGADSPFAAGLAAAAGTARTMAAGSGAQPSSQLSSGLAAAAQLQNAPSAPPLDLASNGRYRRDDELGRGAMGVVYRGFDTVLERVVALKVMGAEVKQFPGAVDMFIQEAKSLAALNHNNIVTVFDQSSDGDELLLVMEFVEGTTLEHVLEKESRLAPEKAIDLTQQLCAGLAYAHGRRVIHRDIKPANVFITNDGTVKLGDFGLARVVNEVRIKQTMVRGTPLYMSPEQIHGSDIDFRADLYAVGCTLYEMLTGRPPFIEGEILYHHLHTEPDPPSRHAPDIPNALDKIVLSCIAKDANSRIASADALRKQLKRIRGQLGR